MGNACNPDLLGVAGPGTTLATISNTTATAAIVVTVTITCSRNSSNAARKSATDFNVDKPNPLHLHWHEHTKSAQCGSPSWQPVPQYALLVPHTPEEEQHWPAGHLSHGGQTQLEGDTNGSTQLTTLSPTSHVKIPYYCPPPSQKHAGRDD